VTDWTILAERETSIFLMEFRSERLARA